MSCCVGSSATNLLVAGACSSTVWSAGGNATFQLLQFLPPAKEAHEWCHHLYSRTPAALYKYHDHMNRWLPGCEAAVYAQLMFAQLWLGRHSGLSLGGVCNLSTDAPPILSELAACPRCTSAMTLVDQRDAMHLTHHAGSRLTDQQPGHTLDQLPDICQSKGVCSVAADGCCLLAPEQPAKRPI
jgi:hypothetical protein